MQEMPPLPVTQWPKRRAASIFLHDYGHLEVRVPMPDAELDVLFCALVFEFMEPMGAEAGAAEGHRNAHTHERHAPKVGKRRSSKN